MSSFVIPEIESWKDKIIAVRHHLHAHPELSLEQFETSQLVVKHLKGYGYKVTQAIGKTGVVGTLTKEVVNRLGYGRYGCATH